MGKIRKILPVKLVIGFIFKEEQILRRTEAILKKYYGGIDFKSQTLDFVYTGYYEKEFGRGLKRKFISFKKLIFPQTLPKIKNTTNGLENKISKSGCRLINIDPGYLDFSKLVLASTKDHYHRIYLDKGIYAEITLFYRDKTFKPWEWTYTDYKTPEYIAIFNKIREKYAACIITQPT